jgi:hypothetical protein
MPTADDGSRTSNRAAVRCISAVAQGAASLGDEISMTIKTRAGSRVQRSAFLHDFFRQRGGRIDGVNAAVDGCQ